MLQEQRKPLGQEEVVVEEHTEETALVPTSVTLPEPARVDEALERAKYIARKLIEVARESGMTFNIKLRNGQTVEGLAIQGWRLLASWCRFGIATEIVEREIDDSGKVVRVRARAYLIRDGMKWAWAEGTATRWDGVRGRIAAEGEERWIDATDDVLESVAQSNAVAEVCKQNLGYILRLGGVKVAEPVREPEKEQETDLTAKDWARFWAQVRTIGLDRQELHDLYGVESMKEVIKSRDDMRKILDELKKIAAP